MAILSVKGGKQPTVTILSEEAVQEHLQQAQAAQKALVDEIREPVPDDNIEPPPKGPNARSD